jgi:hypothetical protein
LLLAVEVNPGNPRGIEKTKASIGRANENTVV